MKKLLTLILIITLFLGNVPVSFAQEAPSAPTAPSVPTVPDSPTAPTAPSSPSSPGSTTSPNQAPEPTRVPRDRDRNHDEEPQASPTQTQTTPSPTSQPTQPTPTGSSNPSPTPTSTPAGEVGDTRVITGDANNNATVVTNGNGNIAANNGEGESASVSTTGNGANSTNATDVDNSSNVNTHQDNSAAVNTNLDQSATTGDNTSSGNVGNTLIKTGDANVSGTVITSVNTNVDGVMVSEFNVADDHQGDIVLDFGTSCISGCGQAPANVNTSGNGANSTNTTNVDNSTAAATFQNNDAAVGNELTLSANSGNNKASENTGGENIIYTGDANVSANALTFANNNIEGNVVYGVVNIYGDLVGDIIFPEEQIANCCANNTTSVATANNGANSTNTTNVDNSNTDNTFQTNDAVINNTLVLDAQTGNNEVQGNTGGDNRVISGDSNVDANVINVANSNLDGGNMWLVIVNEAGKWIGKIIGGDGSNMAASEGTTITTNDQGQVIATNGNGANSTNTTNVDNSTNNTTVQNNTAAIQNTLNLSANTGGNETSNNTGGNSSVVTGDANIVANMVNFVNNNITGNGKLFVTVVNVFGSWLGDFVSPGQQQEVAISTVSPTPVVTNQNIGGSNVTVTTSVEPDEENSNNGSNTVVVNQANPQPTVRQTYRGIVRTAVTTDEDGSVEGAQDEKEHFDAPEATITPVVAGRQVVKVNLAWLIFVIPGGILLFISRRIVRKVRNK